MDKHYDVGVYGLWYGNNYGSIITYYALSKVLDSMGKSYAMIRNPLGKEVDLTTIRRSHPLIFAKDHYEITPLYHLSDMKKLNDLFDVFLIGSDQMWNYSLSRPYKQSYFLDFVDDQKIKVAYGTSFGKDIYSGPEEEKSLTEKNLRRFDAIAVRDNFSKKILEEQFHVPATTVLDPVFLCPREKYDELIKETDFSINEEYIFAYILDPKKEIGNSIEKIAQFSGVKVIVVFNEGSDKEKCWEALGINKGYVDYITEPTVQEWLYLFQNAKFVITDSFHGSCFSIIYRKPFVVLKNEKRGGSRFDHLLSGFGLLDYMVEKPELIVKKFFVLGFQHQIDYDKVYERIKEECLRCKKWLIDIKKTHTDKTKAVYQQQLSQKIHLHPDIERCQMIVSIMKEYGIRHVVISSGTRNLSIARYFEANDCFKTYNVTDERSAAYFALGLSVKLNYEPVIITCTSGTAVANYLPGVTEAFYQRVPLIIITGDRYPCYLGQMEAQMIIQNGLFRDVCKKYVSLPVNHDLSGSWEARRMVCEAVLESTHFVKGPVHINMPINIIEHNPPAPETLALAKVNIIHRIDHMSSEDQWNNAVNILKKSQRVMVIYGQNNPLSDDEQRYFDLFTEKYNCVVLTDHLSNVYNKFCLNPYRLLKQITKDYFKQKLLPDLMIYVGGKRVLNCPLQEKIRSIIRPIKFWHVIEDGSVCDIYRKLTDIFGCSQSQFFKFFAENTGNIQNNNLYLNEWKNEMSKIPPVDWSTVDWTKNKEKFTSYYTMGQLMLNLPKNSMLHLSVGNTFINSHNYPLDSSITVYCNMGTNGIDGSCSSFIGQCTLDNKLGFLMIGDLSFFYDMNSLWNKDIRANVRILLNNDHGAGLLRHYQSRSITHKHSASAEGWVRSLGCFKYICAHNKEEFDELLPLFVDENSEQAIFFEVLF